jgi:hypothetical protein
VWEFELNYLAQVRVHGQTVVNMIIKFQNT